jgi:hypothetical protein
MNVFALTVVSFFRLFLLMADGGNSYNNASSQELSDGSAIVDPWGRE